MSDPTPLHQEQEILTGVIDRLMSEVSDLETICKLLPRLLSVSATLARAKAALVSASPAQSVADLLTTLENLDHEQEESPLW